MIPILYNENTTNFATFGIGALPDTISCEVTEERNGVYELVLKYPVTGLHYGEIKKERLIKAKPNDTSQAQPFRIYRITTPINGIITVYAQHISYDLLGIPVPMWSSHPMMPNLAMEHILASTLIPHNFTFETEYTLPQRVEIVKPKSLRAVIGGSGGSFLDIWGGEFEWDNFHIIQHKSRGADNGVVIEYGKNLTKLDHDCDNSELYTDLLPFAVYTDEEGNETVVTLYEQTLPIKNSVLTQKKILIKDFTDSFEQGDYFSDNELRLKAKDYISANPLGVETPSITISFAALWKQPEYPAILERVSLCDTVTVKHTDYGVSVKQKVIKTVYDTLRERYVSITLGAAKSNFISSVSSTQAEVKQVTHTVDRIPTLMNSAINNATKLITGNKGGYVILHGDSETSMPYELLVLDQPSIEDAVNVWRWNVNGLGFSPNGYNGPYETAITADGKIVADFISTGTLAADIIKAGIISSKDGSSYWNIDTGEVVIKAYATSDALNNAVNSLEGDIQSVETTFSQRATAVEARVTTNETNISSLVVSTNGIAARVTTAEGNISSLTTSVNGVTARVTTAEGNISTLSTEVSGIKTRVSTAEGDISSLEQTATSLTTRITNAENDVSAVEQSVSSITTRVSTAEGNISSLTTSLNGISTRVSTAEGNISTISQNVSSLTTRIETAEGDISTLEQTTTSLSATVSTKVSSEGGSSSSFGWKLTSSGFYLYSSNTTVMSVTSSGLSVSGSVTATSGTIGGFTIGSTKLYKTKTAYSNTTEGVYLGTDGIGLGAGTFYVTKAGYLYATSGKIGGMSISGSQMYSDNFILGTVYDANDSSKSFTTLSFGSTDGTTFSATTVLTNSGCYMYSLSSDYIYCGIIRATSIRADAGISSSTGFYFGYSGGDAVYTAKLSWSGRILYLKVYNSDGVQTALTADKTFTVHYACIWGGDTTWNAKVSAGSSSTSHDTNAFWGIDYATFNYSSSNKSQHSLNFTVSGGSAAETITALGHLVPWYDNKHDLGSAAYRWRNIYGQAGVVNTSDRNEKYDILPMTDIYSTIFDSLIPVTFKYVDNDNERTHSGLVAQDVKAAVIAAGLTTKEFAGYCEWKNEDESVGCGLRYSEFVAINIYEIQKLKARVKELEDKLNITEETKNET